MFINLGTIIIWLIVGFLAGLAANALMGRKSNSAIMDIILGVAGAFVGGWLLSLIGFIPVGFIATLISAVIGAVALLWVVGLLTGSNRRVRF